MFYDFTLRIKGSALSAGSLLSWLMVLPHVYHSCLLLMIYITSRPFVRLQGRGIDLGVICLPGLYKLRVPRG